MTKKTASLPSNFFTQQMAEGYDKRNSGLRPISDCLHFLMHLALNRVPEQARILCVGVGTGAEVLSLAQLRPGWQFVGVDPSTEMLEVAKARLADAGVIGRCKLVHGYVDDVAEDEFDAVLSLLVAHFIERKARPAFYRAIYDRLKHGAAFVSAEISADFDAPEFPSMLEDWKQVQRQMGATEESLAKLETMLREVLGVVSPQDTSALWEEAGLSLPIPFFQAFMIHGWHAVRPAN